MPSLPPAYHAELVTMARSVMETQVQALDRQIEGLQAQRQALAHLMSSDALDMLVQQVQRVFEGRKPSLDHVLLEIFRASGPRMRTADIVRAVVKERRLPVTPEEVDATLSRMSGTFESRGRGWWAFLGDALVGDRQIDQSAACAGGAPA